MKDLLVVAGLGLIAAALYYTYRPRYYPTIYRVELPAVVPEDVRLTDLLEEALRAQRSP